MKNKNMLLFIVLSMGLLGIYYALTSKFAPPPPPPAPVETVQAAPAPAPTLAPAALAVPSLATDPGSLFHLENDELKLTWRKTDGTLVQAEWKKDGTRFFPEEKRDSNGQLVAPAFLGIGGAIDTYFEGDPEVRANEGSRMVSFRNTAGDQLTYHLPAHGHVLDVDWTTRRGAHLFPIRTVREIPVVKDASGREVPMNPLHDMGRLFTLEEKHIDALPWMKTLEDHWYSKRKPLPAAASRVGMDAGIQPEGNQQTHYFAAIWEFPKSLERDTERFPGYHIGPIQDGTLRGRLYLGPKQAEALAAFGKPYLQVMDFGFFGLVAKGMFWVLRAIQGVIPNWGWAIVVFSIILRVALWPLNNKTTVQMLRMKELEPHQKALQAKYEKFGGDMQKKAEMQKELMAFYKKNGHNPMGGCLPMLLQMPVFFALWSMLGAVFELRHAAWIFWIHDLAGPDPYYVLPILLGVSMIAQQAMTPATGDPAQRKMMMFLMPIMMTFFFAKSPVGLCLYYLIFNLVGMVQTWWVMRTYKPQPIVA